MMTGIDGPTEIAKKRKKTENSLLTILWLSTLYFIWLFFSTGTGISPAWNQTWHMVHLIIMHNENGN